MAFIEVLNLNFEYTAKKILKNVSFSIETGSITALVGPNGAGKTTLLRCMASLETPLSGSVVIDGIDVHDFPRQAHRQMGYLSDFFGVYGELTVRQCLTYLAWSHKVPEGRVASKIAEVAERVEITKYLDEKASSLSRGYKQRLGVGLNLVHDPKLLLLDEPASGMDPEARIQLSELMLMMRSQGTTVVVSSHILAELEDYCTVMLVIRDGEIKSHVLLDDHRMQDETLIHISAAAISDHQLSAVSALAGVGQVTRTREGMDCILTGNAAGQALFLSQLVNLGIPVHSFMPGKKTLKNVYMDLAASEEKAAQS